MKIFLSHSSTDKAMVRKIYEELGASLCHFDEATFDPTGSIPSEILSALSSSTHFVLFASPVALASPWVRGELERAFENWMRNGVRRAMVFLLAGSEFGDLPDWLKKYVMREPPTYRHILCRIQSEIDKEVHAASRPPFYRHEELQKIESDLLVETKEMPGAIMCHGPDGSGRKELINEIYSRQYPFVSRRKLLISASSFITEKELFRDLVGLTTITTPSEFAEIFSEFDNREYSDRIEELAKKVDECTAGGQVVLLEGDYALFTEEGLLPEWLSDLISTLSARDYPRLAITVFRRPLGTSVKLMGKLVVTELPPLEKGTSKILFNWWLKSLNKPYSAELKDLVYEACAGSPKQLELGAKLLVAEGSGSIAKIKPHLLSNLEGMSRQFLQELAKSPLTSTVLAFVANAGYIVKSDLTQYLIDSQLASAEAINDAISDCESLGFLLEDEVCLRMPNYLVRGARAIGREKNVDSNLRKLFELQSGVASALKLDDVTSVPVLNEYCLNLLRRGENVGVVFESIILPSQCIQVARSMYESENYEETMALCARAYESRAALSQDGLVETLRYMGMAAARLDRNEEFRTACRQLEEVPDSTKAKRMAYFLNGFKERLDGKFDEALRYLTIAFKSKGEFDIHVLRELASVTLGIGDIPSARRHIKTALNRAPSNQYVIEMAVRVELEGTPADVAKRTSEIELLLDKMQANDSSRDKMYWGILKCDYFLALNQVQEARDFLEVQPYGNSPSPIVDMLKARFEYKSKIYDRAAKMWEALYYKSLKQKNGQRKSTLPLICKNLVESSSAVSASEGADWFERCQTYLPSTIKRALASNLLDAAAYAQGKLSTSQITILRSAAGR
ncbi:toll/interleukin-1 receptor domain-containing protein [Achromobacter sp. ACM02]|uniref:toll/interleukin-1 receptor domain-containing protein n=1 Tax=Achromobacter sp. ACM02 TaxID=2769305 RepID=UPI00177ADCCD|nr:toll/interleukin-1 receptor domain-containing protein [Achromobacter sp. ACM02]MBD9383376.1 toll/interleukin-1 receptor domain-containing protein [Achromobacter sp. ACM02]